MSVAAPPSRLRRLLFRVSLGERGRLTLARTTGLGQESFQLGDAGVALAETLVQLGNVALEQFTQMGELSDQLLVGTGFCARRSVVCQNSQQYVQRLLRWWTPRKLGWSRESMCFAVITRVSANESAPSEATNAILG
jgi:hypothetical protein